MLFMSEIQGGVLLLAELRLSPELRHEVRSLSLQRVVTQSEEPRQMAVQELQELVRKNHDHHEQAAAHLRLPEEEGHAPHLKTM